MVWLPSGEKFEDMLTRFDKYTNVTDRQTLHHGIGRVLFIASPGTKCSEAQLICYALH